MTTIEIGRLLRAGISGFVVGCRINQLDLPTFGALVRVPLASGYQVFGLVHDIFIDDDGLVRQLVTAEGLDEAVFADNRVNRNVPAELSVLAIGYQQDGRIYHLLPPHPPLSLDLIYLCDEGELCRFSEAGRFGYFRHILRSQDLPVGELLAAHIQQAGKAHQAAGNVEWVNAAAQELIILLRDDYPTLMSVLGALSDVSLNF
jgi:hypothetical protein